ncbi:unnamed protein product [Mytilus coruscus]|uniref:Uncharacterized protein n=1 Tax=Mytilus coruscus TaxID=42192 RepID=A0A6J8B733_MYTCO|nr:unnamed protein product [Mytilus coruscus]
MYQNGNRRRINTTENPPLVIPLEEIEEVYEEIDESNMIDDVENLMNINLSDSDTNGSYVLPNSNDYLTPCQPTDEDAKTNNLNENKSESSSSFDENHKISSDHESTSSSSEMIGERSSYLNPYEPIIHSVDINEYSSTHKIDDSGSSESDTQTMESGYLNPYQPIVPDRDLHEYKSVLKCSDGSDFAMSDECTKEMGVEFPHPYQDLKSEIDTHEFKLVDDIASDTVSTNLDIATYD